jgi:5-methylcytosine-specific restriction endonuclease McrA
VAQARCTPMQRCVQNSSVARTEGTTMTTPRNPYHHHEAKRTALRQQAWHTYPHTCWRCGTDLEHQPWDLDHLHRLTDGGNPYDLDNVRPACRPCNRGRGSSLHITTPPTPSRDW